MIEKSENIKSLRQIFSDRIHSAMIESLSKKIVTHSIYGMLNSAHAVEVAKRLVGPNREDKEIKAGLRKLARAGRLDLSFESILLEEEFYRLFCDADRTWARWNLKEVDSKYIPSSINKVAEADERTIPYLRGGTEWSEEELRASLVAYFDIQLKERTGQKYEKVSYYRDLSSRFRRSAKAFELRMQNISYVLLALERSWIKGLPPARNVDVNVAVQIEKLIGDILGEEIPPRVEFYMRVQELLKKPATTSPPGAKNPARTSCQITQIVRDPTVKAWALQQANGKCGCCMRKAPFHDQNGKPFLEVHHVCHLADGGSDTPQNAVAICPNCHRELHQGSRNVELIEQLYARNAYLVRE
jgi:5-methylcytosine-specific restriction protein A